MDMMRLIGAGVLALSLSAAAANRTVTENWTLEQDETVDGALTVNSGVTVDLAGHKLTVKGLGTAAGTITSSSAGGVLDIDVDSGVTVDNTAVTLTGGSKLQVWKTGAGTLNMTKANTGFGGEGVVSLVVKAGIVKKNPDNTDRACCGAQFSKLVVEDGGQIEIGGNGYYRYDFELAGSGPDGMGALACKTANANWETAKTKDQGYFRNITLTADATVGGTEVFGMLYYRKGGYGAQYNGTMTMNGHTLTYRSTKSLYCWNMVYSGSGTIVVSGESNGTFQLAMGDTSAADCDFIVYGKIGQNGDKISPVKSLVFEPSGSYAGRAANQEDKQMIVVHEKYAPNLNYSNNTYPTMRVTLGASGHTATTLDLGYFTNRTFNASATTFYSGSTVTVDTGEREIAHGDKLVSWSSAPNATFTLQTTMPDVEVVTRSDGLYVKSTLMPAYAVWNTEKAGDVKWDYYMADGTPFPHEWTDGVTSDIQVRFSSFAEYEAIRTRPETPHGYLLTSLVLPEGSAEYNMTNLNYAVSAGATIDLKGNTLIFPYAQLRVADASAFTITDSTAANGQLVIDVPSGQTVENTSVTLTGSLRFVKRGAGTFIPTKLYQPYTGGNEVAAGTVKLSIAHNQHDGYFNELGGFIQGAGAYAEVDILPGATVDQNGQTGLRSYMFVLKGGTLTNNGADLADSAAALFYMRLADADRSYFNLPHSTGFYRDLTGETTLDLGGKTLQMGITAGKYFYLNNTTISNGTLDIVSGGYLYTMRTACNARNANINLNCALNLSQALSVSNIVVKYNGDWDHGPGALKVYGAFRPETAGGYFYGPTMQNGSTLDFSAWNAASLGWPVKSRSTYSNVSRTFKFASDAASVKVTLGSAERTKALALSEDPYILKWGNGAEKPSATVFSFADGDDSAQGCELRSDGTGLKVVPKPGFTIRVAEKDVTVPGAWVVEKMGAAFVTENAVDWLSAAGANGLPRWQSWLLGLEPSDSRSVVLCRAADTQPGDGTFAVGANIDVQAGSGAAVTAYLDTSADGEAWTENVASQALSDGGTVSFSRSLASGECGFYRIRLAVQ